VSGGPRRVRLYVSRFDPWSVTKAAFILSLAIAIVLVIAVTAVWFILDRTGVIESLSGTVTDVVGSTSGLDLVTSLGFGQVIGSTEIILVSALAGLFTILYNLTVGITGGVEVVLSDDA
jgi:hypothetical protein